MIIFNVIITYQNYDSSAWCQMWYWNTLHILITNAILVLLCCCYPCNHCSKLVVEEMLVFLGLVLRTAGRSFKWNYADPLTSLELLNYCLPLAMSSGRFCIKILRIDRISKSPENLYPAGYLAKSPNRPTVPLP